MFINFFPTLKASVLLAGAALTLASACASESSCITAGRINDAGNWSPQFQSVRLLDDTGRRLSIKLKSELTLVRGVELTEPALLSGCVGDREIARGNDVTPEKAPVPAAKAGRLNVISVGFPKLQVGGELVELKVQVNDDQIVMITR